MKAQFFFYDDSESLLSEPVYEVETIEDLIQSIDHACDIYGFCFLYEIKILNEKSDDN